MGANGFLGPTASPIQRTNNLAVGARVSDIYLGLAPKLKLENILMLSRTDGHFRDPPRANAVLFAGIYDFFGLKYAPVYALEQETTG